jgi:hypothetical protein
MKDQSISVTTLAGNGISIKLLLEGQLILKNADLIKKELLAALNSSQHIELVFKNIIKLDLAILQLLVGLQKSAAEPGKNLSFDFQLSDTIQAVIRNSGLEKLLIPNFKMQLNGVY